MVIVGFAVRNSNQKQGITKMNLSSARSIGRFLPPFLILVLAGAVSFQENIRSEAISLWNSLVSSHVTGAEAASNPATGACEDACCAGKKTASSPATGACEDACCAGKKTASSPATGACEDACCAGKKQADEPNAACCPACANKAAASKSTQSSCCPSEKGSAGAGAAQANKIVWTDALIQDYKKNGDWCTEHGVPESMCIRCNSALIEAFKARGDWCSSHEVPASLCSICRKELVELGMGRDWCEKHGLPASQCVQCNPSRISGSHLPQPLVEQARLEISTQVEDEIVQGFQEVLSEGGKTQNQAERSGINPNCPLHHVKIQLKSADVSGEAGLEMVPVLPRSLSHTIECYGDIQYDQSRYALLSPLSGGIVHSVQAEPGRQVAEGEILATVDSSDFGKAKAELLRSMAALNRCKWMVESFENGTANGGVARKEMVQAQADLDSAEIELAIARQTLKNFGLNDQELDQVATSRDTSTLLPVRAPFDGTIVERKAVPGEMVESGQVLFAVTDLSRMWLCLDLPAEDLSSVEIGMPLSFKVDGSRNEIIRGVVSWISSELDPRTRTGQVRAELDNPDHSLRAGLFGQGSIALHQDDQVLAVPAEAVQWDGCCNVVFVSRGADTFEPRKVRLGYEQDGMVLVRAGLLEGESVVTRGSYLMKTEILKANIGAGCCADHAAGSHGAEKAHTAHESAQAPAETSEVQAEEIAHAAH